MKGLLQRIGLLVIMPILAGVSLPHCEWQGPSRFFIALDSDGNDEVSLDEWMDYYGEHSHPWIQCSGKDFGPADCDESSSLSWSEYHAYRFRYEWCKPRTAYLWYDKPVFDLTTGRFVLRRHHGH